MEAGGWKPAWYDYITVNIYWLGLTTLSQTNGLVVPLLVQRFVGEAEKGSYFGTLRLWTLMVALLAQALMGMVSDQSRPRWGRRRPFIFAGTLADLLFITAIGLSAGMVGMAGYWFLFGTIILLQVSSNTAQAAEQGLIPDLVPEARRGRFSGLKALFEIPLPLILVAFLISPRIAAGDIWGGLLIAIGVLSLTMLLTMLVKEHRLTSPPSPLDWPPFLRLGLMTALFTSIILGMGEAVRQAGRLVEAAPMGPQLVVMGIGGMAAMVISITVGVWLAVRIGIGGGSTSSFTWWVINRLAFLVGANNLSSFAIYFLQGRLGYAEEEAAGPASKLIMAVGLFILLSALPSGWLSDRLGHKRVVAISGLTATLGTLVLLLSPTLPAVYIGGCIVGLGAGLFFTANWALGTQLVPRERAGRYLGLSNLAGAGAGAVGAYIGGPIADYFTRQVPGISGLGYVLLFAIYGGLFLFSAIALRQIHPPPRTGTT